VLAAGRSERLSGITKGSSKALLPLGGIPLVERAVRTLRDAGVERVVVVVGYQGDEVANAARLAGGDVVVVHAPDWETGNATSLAAAEPQLAGEPSFLLLCGDHAFSRGALVPLAEAGEPAVLVDESPTADAWDEGTRVSIEDGRITAFGKSLPDPAIDCGAFRLDRRVFDAYRVTSAAGDHSLAGAVTAMGRVAPIRAVRLQETGWWQDIDTPQDLRLAKHRLRQSLAKPTDGPVSRYLNRPISTRITMALSAARIPPAAFSVFTAMVGLWAAWSLSASRAVVGGIFVQAASILDGIDGETARLQWRTSERGALLDDLLDRMVDAVIVAGICLWLWDDPSRPFRTMIIVMTAAAWPFIHLAVKKPFQVFEVPPSAGRRPLLVVVGSRDVRLLIVAGLCFVDRPWIALVAGTLAYVVSVLRRIPFMLARVGRGILRRFRPLRVMLPDSLRRDAPARAAAPHEVGQPADGDLREERQEPEDEYAGDDG
jgi:1L-myo-inositol 1-phosphate cytidylyltransferase / CDP-L-myo-inositol myo-inositolphosphotransferase